MKAFIQLTNNRSCLLRADEIKADYERGHITVLDGGRIQGVLSQPSQFHGYSPNFPVWDELYAVALDVLTRWSLEKQGVTVERELPNTYLWFTGYNGSNHFREEY